MFTEDEIHLPKGFALQEDDHVLSLFHEGEVVDRFSATGVDPKEVEKSIAKHQKEKH